MQNYTQHLQPGMLVQLQSYEVPYKNNSIAMCPYLLPLEMTGGEQLLIVWESVRDYQSGYLSSYMPLLGVTVMVVSLHEQHDNMISLCSQRPVSSHDLYMLLPDRKIVRYSFIENGDNSLLQKFKSLFNKPIQSPVRECKV